VAKGYRVFLDIEALNPGAFNEQLLDVIEHCTDFVLVCSKDSLKRCKREGDRLTAYRINEIQSLVYQTPYEPSGVHDAPQAERALVNSSGQDYDITVVGDLDSQFDCKTLIGSELERRALQKHLTWGDEASFYRSEYNYRSSMATAIHEKWRLACGITPEDAPVLEHRRWMAYMRGLGYVYGPERNDRAKTHPDLVPYERLSRGEQEKDIRMTGGETE
jgi:hypothetical protein